MISSPPRERVNRPGHGPGRDGDGNGERRDGIAKIRALVLIVVAVLLGVVLLHVDGASGRSTENAAAATTRATTVPTTSTTTTTTTVPVKPSSSVKVLVANGKTVNGAAAFFTGKLGKLGWGTLVPTTTSTPATASAVYYASGQEGAANVIAASLGLKPSVVQPLTSSVPVPGDTAASVVVVVGPDLAPQVTAAGG